MQNHTEDNNVPVPPPEIVATPAALQSLVARLMQATQVAVDTEANSLHAYQEQVCLIQFSISAGDYVVDALALDDLSPLAPFFAAPTIEKIFHAADYDLIILKRDHQLLCHNLFDTMWAARILGWPKVGLGNVLEEHFNIHLNKKFQRYDWGKRPLDPKALRYAGLDTHYLRDLRALQAAALKELGRWEEAQEVFTYLCNHVPDPQPPDPDEFYWRIKGVRDLPYHEQAMLYRLYRWREAAAERLDRPTMKVMSSRQLVKVAQVQPRTRQALADAGLTPYQIRRFGDEILKAVRQGPLSPPSQPHDHTRPPDEVLERYDVLKAWRKDVAAQRGVDSDVILPNATLWNLAWHPPQELDDLEDDPAIGPWRCKTYGPQILKLLTRLR